MQANNDFDKKIIQALKSLPLVSLSTEEKQGQLEAVAAAISTGAIAMKEFSIARLVLDRIREELAKYLVFTMLVASFLILGGFGYLAYTHAPLMPEPEMPAITKKLELRKPPESKPKSTKTKKEEETQKQEEEAADEITTPEDEANASTESTESTESTATESNESEEQPASSEAPAGEQQSQAAATASNQAPNCSLQVLSQAPLIAGNPVKFLATFSDTDGQIEKVKWDLGDGNSLEHGPEITVIQHVYSTPGNYTVTLTVFDNGGSSAQVSKSISISGENRAPTADFSSNAPKEAGEPVSFTNKSNDPDGLIVEIKWDFGDGKTSTNKNPTHTFDKAGNYTVTLEVIDDDGASSKISKNVEIKTKNQPPQCSFHSNDPKKKGHVVRFWPSFEDTDGRVVKLRWDFGNGATITDNHPGTDSVEYTYDHPGDYKVTLSAFDDRGAASSFSKIITIFRNRS